MTFSVVSQAVYQDWNCLIEYVGFSSHNDLNKFIAEWIFQPFYKKLYNAVIKSQQNDVMNKQSQQQDFDLWAVQVTELQGEKETHRKYSTQYSDKINWKIKNHYVHFLWTVCEKNIKNINEIFYEKKKDWSVQDNKIWSILKWIAFDAASSWFIKFTDLHLMKTTSLEWTADAVSDAVNVLDLWVVTDVDDDELMKLAEISDIFKNRLNLKLLFLLRCSSQSISSSSSCWIKQEKLHSSLQSSSQSVSNSLEFILIVKATLNNAECILKKYISILINLNKHYWRKMMMNVLTRNYSDEWQYIITDNAHLYNDDYIINAMSIEWEHKTEALNKKSDAVYVSLMKKNIEQFDILQKHLNNVTY